MKPMFAAIRSRFLRFRREVIVVAYAIRHPGTPLRWRLAGTVLILYLLSPIDLIPVVVPVLGILDDLIIVPLGLSLVVGRLPGDVRSDAEADATRIIQRYVARPLRFFLYLVVALILVWTATLWLLWWLFLSG